MAATPVNAGGAIQVSSGSVIIDLTTFTHFSAVDGGALALTGFGASVRVSRTDFNLNIALRHGGAIFIGGGNLTMRMMASLCRRSLATPICWHVA